MTNSTKSMRAPYEYLAARAFNTPLLLDPSKAKILLSVLSDKLKINSITDVDGQDYSPTEIMGSLQESFPMADHSRFINIVDGVAIIDVRGTIVQRQGSIRPYSGMTGLNGLQNRIIMALENPMVKAILLDIDSPGGEVAGLFDFADFLFESRGPKPITAFINETAASAAFAIASAADEIVIPRTGRAGSVGVIMAHVDFSKQIEGAGVDVSLIFAGAHKADGNPYTPLPDSVRAEFQQGIDELRALFSLTIARNRNMADASVLATEAKVFMGQTAVDIGFADRVGTFQETFETLRDSVSVKNRLITNPGGTRMSETKPGATASATTDDDATPETEATVTAETSQETAAGDDTQASTAPELSDEKQRIKSILTHAEADGRSALANHLAFETDNSVEASVAILSASTKIEAAAEAAAPKELLDAAMGNVGGNGIAPDGSASGEPRSVNRGTTAAVKYLESHGHTVN